MKSKKSYKIRIQRAWKGEDWRKFKSAKDCHICGKELRSDPVRDHCHITGRFRGAAHNTCNLKWRISQKLAKIPVVFHNLRGYDGHFLMSAIGEEEGKMACIPNNMEKYGGVSWPPPQDRHASSGWCFWELPGDLPCPLWSWPCSLLQKHWFILGRTPENDRSRTGATDRLWQVPVLPKWDARGD